MLTIFKNKTSFPIKFNKIFLSFTIKNIKKINQFKTIVQI